MDFIDILKQFSQRTEKLLPQIKNEEQTKTALIMPFFQTVLGYDVFNPDEFVPEFTADVGIKKGEKVDYAILLSGEPEILIEAKWSGEPLEKHDSQLFRYFGTTKAKLGILTNGIAYKFYSDLNEQNKMDLTPFLEFDILNMKESAIFSLKKFCKSIYNSEEILSCASELKYSGEIKNYFSEQLREPSDDFVKFMISSAYDGVKTSNVIEKFRPIVKASLNNFISEMMNDRIKTALKNDNSEKDSNEINTGVVSAEETHESKIITTEEELEAYGIIKGILSEMVDPSLITYRDTENYINILYGNKVTKWICRLFLDDKKKKIMFPGFGEPPLDKPTKHDIDTINDLYSHKETLVKSVKRFITI